MATFRARIVELYNSLRDLNVQKYGRKDFADYLGVSIGKSNGWLDGTGSPDFEVLKQISKNTGISILWLIGANDDMYIIPADDLNLPEAAKEEYQILVKYLKFKYGVLDRLSGK